MSLYSITVLYDIWMPQIEVRTGMYNKNVKNEQERGFKYVTKKSTGAPGTHTPNALVRLVPSTIQYLIANRLGLRVELLRTVLFFGDIAQWKNARVCLALSPRLSPST